MSDQAPPSEHDQLAYLVEVEIPALEAELSRYPEMARKLGWLDPNEAARLRAERDTRTRALRRARAWIVDGSEDAGHLLGVIDSALASAPEQAASE